LCARPHSNMRASLESLDSTGHSSSSALQRRLRARRLSRRRRTRCHKLYHTLAFILPFHPQIPSRLFLPSPMPTPSPSFPSLTLHKRTSLCALCAIISARSCSTIICSSLYASAHGTPNNSALVLTTHSVLPPSTSPDLNQLVVVFTLEDRLRRAEAGMMSCSARRRS
jgi:hypothetical protein